LSFCVQSLQSFGINVATLAGLPDQVLTNAKRVSQQFEEEIKGGGYKAKQDFQVTEEGANESMLRNILNLVEKSQNHGLLAQWEKLHHNHL
jgi:DNA mismatch repair ATPase MutS